MSASKIDLYKGEISSYLDQATGLTMDDLPILYDIGVFLEEDLHPASAALLILQAYEMYYLKIWLAEAMAAKNDFETDCANAAILRLHHQTHPAD
jgi:hypothetical protein